MFPSTQISTRLQQRRVGRSEDAWLFAEWPQPTVVEVDSARTSLIVPSGPSSSQSYEKAGIVNRPSSVCPGAFGEHITARSRWIQTARANAVQSTVLKDYAVGKRASGIGSGEKRWRPGAGVGFAKSQCRLDTGG
jgi:hypothetical protein